MIRAWRASGSALVETERPDPTPGPDDVVVAVEAFVLGPRERSASDDTIAGGAAVGRVTASGEAASHLVGARVAVGPYWPCGECDVCRRGNACVCPSGDVLGRSRDGTMAESVVAAARWVCRVDGELDIPGSSAALLPREATDAYAMWARAGVSPGEPVVVVGDGPVARLVEQIATARGCKPSRPADAEPTQKPRRIFETTGTADSRAAALAAANAGATIALYSTETNAPLDIATLVPLDATVVAIAGAHPDLMPEVAALAVKGDLALADAARVAGIGDDIAAAIADADQAGKALVIEL